MSRHQRVVQGRSRQMHHLLLAAVLVVSLPGRVQAQDYLDQLITHLKKTEYRLDYQELLSLQRVQDYQERIDILVKIIEDRQRFEDTPSSDDSLRTEIVCSALHLLDEIDLPRVAESLSLFLGQKDWNPRERLLLAFVSAKRDIQYSTNVANILTALSQYEVNLSRGDNADVARTIDNLCSCLAYLSELFVIKGDESVLEDLFLYVRSGFGYPAEYFSKRLGELFVSRPVSFITVLAGHDDPTIHAVVNALVFGLKTHAMRKKVENLVQDESLKTSDPARKLVSLLSGEIRGF